VCKFKVMQANKNKIPRVPPKIPKWEDEEIIPNKSSSQKINTFDDHAVVLYEIEVRGGPFSGAGRRIWHRSTEKDDNSTCPHWIRAHNRNYFFAKDINDTVEDVYPTVPPICSEGKAHTWEWKSDSAWKIDKTRARQIQIGEIYVPGYRAPSMAGYSAVDEKGWEYSTDLARFDDRQRPMRGVLRLTDRVRRRRWVRHVEIEGHRNVKVQENAFSVQDDKISHKAEGNQGRSSLPVSSPSQAAQLPLEEKESGNEARRSFQGLDGDDSTSPSKIVKKDSPRHNRPKSHAPTQAERVRDSVNDRFKTLTSSKATIDENVFKKVDKAFWNRKLPGVGNKPLIITATLKSHDDSMWDVADAVMMELNETEKSNLKPF